MVGQALGLAEGQGAGLSTSLTVGLAFGRSISIAAGVPVRRYGDNPAARIVRAKGDTMLLKRVGEATTIMVKGKLVTTGETSNTGGSTQLRRNHIRIGPTEIEASAWADPWPLPTDTIEVEGLVKKVAIVEPLRIGDRIQIYLLTVSG